MSMHKAIILEFRLGQADIETVGEVSSKIRQELIKRGIRPEIIRRIAISAYEAATNVVIHAYQGIIKAMIFSDRTELLVSDEGPGISNMEMALKPGYSTAPEYARKLGFGGGTGLLNITRFPDECTIKSVSGAGTTIHLIIRHK